MCDNNVHVMQGCTYDPKECMCMCKGKAITEKDKTCHDQSVYKT